MSLYPSRLMFREIYSSGYLKEGLNFFFIIDYCSSSKLWLSLIIEAYRMERKLPEGWKKIEISTLCDKIETINPLNEPNKEFEYIDIDSIDNHNHCITKPKIVLGVNAPSRARQKVLSGDIVFSTVRPYLKNIAIVPDVYKNLVASTGFSIIRINNETTKKFLYYYLLTDYLHEKLSLLYRGANYPAISNSNLKNQIIPLPPLDTQRQIVAILETAEKIQWLRAESDALTQRLLQSVFLEMFGDPVTNPMGWEITTIGDITVFHKQGLYCNDGYSSSGVRLLRISDILDDGTISYENMPLLNLECNVINQFRVNINDFVFARSGVSIGRCGLVDTDIQCVFGSFIIKFALNLAVVNKYFLLHLIRHPKTQEQLKKFTHGSANPNVNAEDIKNVKIFIPPIDLQNKFASIVSYHKKIARNQQYCKDVEKKFINSLFNKAFIGELIT